VGQESPVAPNFQFAILIYHFYQPKPLAFLPQGIESTNGIRFPHIYHSISLFCPNPSNHHLPYHPIHHYPTTQFPFSTTSDSLFTKSSRWHSFPLGQGLPMGSDFQTFTIPFHHSTKPFQFTIANHTISLGILAPQDKNYQLPISPIFPWYSCPVGQELPTTNFTNFPLVFLPRRTRTTHHQFHQFCLGILALQDKNYPPPILLFYLPRYPCLIRQGEHLTLL
jgi:hypothetical protein